MASNLPMAAPLRAIKTNAHTILALGILVCCAGCGTMGNGIFGIPRPYGGVQEDIKTISGGGAGVCMVLDLPFSAVADTLLLFPMDLPNAPPLRDPLKGWTSLGSKTGHSYETPDAITQDIQSYLAEQKSHGHPSVLGTTFYEDGTGRHAVRMEVYFDGYTWNYTLIYDNSNVRTKAIKYIIGRSMC